MDRAVSQFGNCLRAFDVCPRAFSGRTLVLLRIIIVIKLLHTVNRLVIFPSTECIIYVSRLLHRLIRSYELTVDMQNVYTKAVSK